MKEKVTGLRYQPGELRFKHKWKKYKPGFEDSGSQKVAKCPRDFDFHIAQELLNKGVYLAEQWEPEDYPPKRVYNVYNGIPYVALRNAPGSWEYHGFPLGFRRVRRDVYSQLWERARQEGYVREFEQWCKKYRVMLSG